MISHATLIIAFLFINVTVASDICTGSISTILLITSPSSSSNVSVNDLGLSQGLGSGKQLIASSINSTVSAFSLDLAQDQEYFYSELAGSSSGTVDWDVFLEIKIAASSQFKWILVWFGNTSSHWVHRESFRHQTGDLDNGTEAGTVLTLHLCLASFKPPLTNSPSRIRITNLPNRGEATVLMNLVSLALVRPRSSCKPGMLPTPINFAYKSQSKLYHQQQDDSSSERNRKIRFLSLNYKNMVRGTRLEQEDLMRTAAAMLNASSTDAARVIYIEPLALAAVAWGVPCPYCIVQPGNPPRTYSEDVLQRIDYILFLARKYNVRLLLTFLPRDDFYNQLCSVRSNPDPLGCMFYDPTVMDDLEHLISTILNRVNTLTGIVYKQDPFIFAWSLGEDMSFNTMKQRSCPPYAWVSRFSSLVKSIDPHHLLVYECGDPWTPVRSSFDEFAIPHIDIYGLSSWNLHESYDNYLTYLTAAAAFNKTLILFQLGMGPFFEQRIRSIARDMLTEKFKGAFAGAFVSSLQGRKEGGGFYQSKDDYAAGLHFPGYKSDIVPDSGIYWQETSYINLIYTMHQLLSDPGKNLSHLQDSDLVIQTPQAPMDYAPILLKSSNDDRWLEVSWFGVVGGTRYHVYRSFESEPYYRAVSTGLDEFAHHTGLVDTKVPFNATCRQTVTYRLFATNDRGTRWSPALVLSIVSGNKGTPFCNQTTLATTPPATPPSSTIVASTTVVPNSAIIFGSFSIIIFCICASVTVYVNYMRQLKLEQEIRRSQRNSARRHRVRVSSKGIPSGGDK